MWSEFSTEDSRKFLTYGEATPGSGVIRCTIRLICPSGETWRVESVGESRNSPQSEADNRFNQSVTELARRGVAGTRLAADPRLSARWAAWKATRTDLTWDGDVAVIA